MKKYIFNILLVLFLFYIIKKFFMKDSSGSENSYFDKLLFDTIAKHEGFRPKMYLDTGGQPTIGYGTLIDKPGEQYLKKATITKEQGFELMKKDLQPIINYVNSIDGLNDRKKVALISLGYNIGLGDLNKSTLMKKVNANPNDKTIELEFLKWNKDQDPKTGNLVAVSGLTIRRQKESNLYFS